MSIDTLRHHRPGMLRDLIPETDNLEMRGTSVFAKFRYKVPVNEFNIPQREALIIGAIEAAHGKLDWQGITDDHHLAWPKCLYQNTGADTDEMIGRKYRASRSLRFMGPRQLHEWLHVGFAAPPQPDIDIMDQYNKEDEQLLGLYAILQYTRDERESCTIDAQQEIGRRARYLDRLDKTQPAQIGHLPNLEYLANLQVDEARIEIGQRVRYLTFSEARKKISTNT